jgi:hypothetical protein
MLERWANDNDREAGVLSRSGAGASDRGVALPPFSIWLLCRPPPACITENVHDHLLLKRYISWRAREIKP